jgi:hypothetical protein
MSESKKAEGTNEGREQHIFQQNVFLIELKYLKDHIWPLHI